MNPTKRFCKRCDGERWHHDVTNVCLVCGTPYGEKGPPKTEQAPPPDEPGFL